MGTFGRGVRSHDEKRGGMDECQIVGQRGCHASKLKGGTCFISNLFNIEQK